MIKLKYWSDCSLGPIYYGTDQYFVIYIDGGVIEPFYDESEEGTENGDGDLIYTFRRQIKRYKLVTQELPSHIIDALYRMRMNDYILMTWADGDKDYIYNVSIEHNWYEESKTLAIATITFDLDERCSKSACCTEVAAIDIAGIGTVETASTADTTVITADSTVITADAG